jgi:hypothetical protein
VLLVVLLLGLLPGLMQQAVCRVGPLLCCITSKQTVVMA